VETLPNRVTPHGAVSFVSQDVAGGRCFERTAALRLTASFGARGLLSRPPALGECAHRFLAGRSVVELIFDSPPPPSTPLLGGNAKKSHPQFGRRRPSWIGAGNERRFALLEGVLAIRVDTWNFYCVYRGKSRVYYHVQNRNELHLSLPLW